MHVNMRRIHPRKKKKSSVSIQTIVVLFRLVAVNDTLVLFELFVTYLLLFEHQQKTAC